MTLTWILVGFTLLLMSLLIRAMPRLIPQIYSSSMSLTLFSIVFILTFSLLLYYWKLSLIFAAFFLSLSIAAGMLDPVFGFCVYLSFILFRPWEMWPYDTIFNLLPRLGALWIIFLSAFSYLKQRQPTVAKESTLVILFFIWCLVTTIKSDYPIGNIILLIPSLVLFLLIQFWIEDPHDYDLISDSLSLGIIVTAILAIILFLNSQNDGGRIEAMGILSNSNDIAALCVLAFPFTLRPLLSDNPTKSKLTPLLSILLSIPLLSVIYFSQSRGAIIATFVMIGTWISFRFKPKWYHLLLFLFISLGALTLFTSSREKDDLGQSQESRISYWIAGGNMFLQNPFLGVGMNKYPAEFENYSKNHLYEFGNRTAHSSWVLILAETGLPGFLMFISIFVHALKGTWKARHIYPESFLGLLGYTVTMTFLSHSYLFYPYLTLGLSFAVIRLHQKLESGQ